MGRINIYIFSDCKKGVVYTGKSIDHISWKEYLLNCYINLFACDDWLYGKRLVLLIQFRVTQHL